jgi:hypothetical protein
MIDLETRIIMKKCLFGLVVFAMVATAAHPQTVSLKLTGGLTWINGGDYNLGLSGQNRLLGDTLSSLSGAYLPLNNGFHGQVEIIHNLNPHLAVGLGGGYYRVSREGRVTGGGLILGVPFSLDSAVTAKVSVIPFFINLHYLALVVSRLSLDVFAGPVFNVVQFNYVNASSTTLLAAQTTETFTASHTAVGGQAGVGLNFEIIKGVSFVAEGCYRYAKVKDFQGNWSRLGTSSLGPVSQTSSVSDMWFYRLNVGSTYDQFGFFDSIPQGSSISGARRAEIDLSGFNASAGFKFSF